MAGDVVNIKNLSSLKLHTRTTGSYHVSCH